MYERVQNVIYQTYGKYILPFYPFKLFLNNDRNNIFSGKIFLQPLTQKYSTVRVSCHFKYCKMKATDFTICGVYSTMWTNR